MSTDVQAPLQKILVVDDSEHNRQVAEGYLATSGYAVALAKNGEAGLAAFTDWQPDLVLLDVLMPGLDGFETCRRMRALPGGKDVPIVFFTALSDLGSHQKALESGADDYLSKPINRTELILRVRSLLWIKRLREQKEELSALIVHDLKNPLTILLANVQCVIEEPHLKDEDRESLGDALHAGEAMLRMIMNLLDISRSEDGELVIHPVEVDLAGLIAEVCAAFKSRCAARRVRIALSAVQPLSARGDRDLLQRVLENLVDNALKHTDGEGDIEVAARRIDDKGSVEIRVGDGGSGVPPEFREKIFDKYFQLESDARTRVRTSRGLGLSFCRLAVAAHGGRIWVEDRLPKGSFFCILLPH